MVSVLLFNCFSNIPIGSPILFGKSQWGFQLETLLILALHFNSKDIHFFYWTSQCIWVVHFVPFVKLFEISFLLYLDCKTKEIQKATGILTT